MPAALITETKIDFLHRVSPAGTQRVLQTLQTRLRDGWRGKRRQEEPGSAKRGIPGRWKCLGLAESCSVPEELQL